MYLRSFYCHVVKNDIFNIRYDSCLKNGYVMLKSQQIKAARALLGWSQDKLANSSGVSIASIRRIEGQKDYPKAHTDTLMKIEKSLHQAGITFTGNDNSEGVSLTQRDNRSVT